MHRIVATAFKAIALSMLFMVIWSVAFYLFRVYNLNQRIETVMTSMEQEVSSNNYMSEDARDMYASILTDITRTMNGGVSSGDDSFNTGNYEFVADMRLNWGSDCLTPPHSTGLTYSYDLSKPADYGDVAVIELRVYVRALDLGFDSTADSGAESLTIGFGTDGIVQEFVYRRQVPCLKYISVNGTV